MNLDEQLKIIEFISNNREHLMEKIEGIKFMKESSMGTIPQIFHDDVMDQYNSRLRTIVVQEIAMNTKVNAETIHVVLDEFDLKGYLNG